MAVPDRATENAAFMASFVNLDRDNGVNPELIPYLVDYVIWSERALDFEIQLLPGKTESSISEDVLREYNDQARLALLKFKYFQRLTKAKIPFSGEFTNPAEYEFAAKLVSTFRDICLLEKKLDLTVTERPEIVSQLNSLAMKYYREHGPSRRSTSNKKDSPG